MLIPEHKTSVRQRDIARISRNVRYQCETGESVERACTLRGTCVGFARKVMPFLFERDREG